MDLPDTGIKPRSLTLQADSLPAEPQGKPKSTGVGGLSLLQWIFPTQESNWGLLHCRQIVAQLSYQEMGLPKSFACSVTGWEHSWEMCPEIRCGRRSREAASGPSVNHVPKGRRSDQGISMATSLFKTRTNSQCC